MTGVNIQTIFFVIPNTTNSLSNINKACDVQRLLLRVIYKTLVKTLKNIIISCNFDFYKTSGETIIKRFPSKSDQNVDIYQRVKTIQYKHRSTRLLFACTCALYM